MSKLSTLDRSQKEALLLSKYKALNPECELSGGSLRIGAQKLKKKSLEQVEEANDKECYDRVRKLGVTLKTNLEQIG